MIDLYNDTTGELVGSITEADLKVLVDALEEESSADRDYYIDACVKRQEKLIPNQHQGMRAESLAVSTHGSVAAFCEPHSPIATR